MIRTQIQIPDELYHEAKRVAADREWSLAELCRRGLEYMVNVCPPVRAPEHKWKIPDAVPLGGEDPFADPGWREKVHLPDLEKRKVAEERKPWGEGEGDA